MELVLIKIGSTEWEYILNWVENHPLNKGLENPRTALNNGEEWQYMGSFKNKERVIHSLRHLNHPVTESVQNISVQCSDGFNDEQIHREYKA